MLFKAISGVRLVEESLIIVCAGRLHTVLYMSSLCLIQGKGGGGGEEKGSGCFPHVKYLQRESL